VGSFNLPLVLEAVAQLEVEVSNIGRCSDDLVTSASVVAAPVTVLKIRGAHRRAERAIDTLRSRLLDDASDEPSREHREWTFRARAIVLALQMPELKRYEREVGTRLWPARGRFASIAELCSYILERIGEINGRWLVDRRAIDVVGCDGEAARERAYLGALTEAERGLCNIGMEPDVACLLAAGAAMSSVGFRTACRVVAALLGVSLAPAAIAATSPTGRPDVAMLTFRLSLQAEEEP
jgi:hypothetical protein